MREHFWSMQATAEEAGEHATIKRARQVLHRRMKVSSFAGCQALLICSTYVSQLCMLQICVKDGRILVGDLLCLDQQGNIILGNTCEQISGNAR